jgi:ParB family transcriptional regulator, chromosome partitioning protein
MSKGPELPRKALGKGLSALLPSKPSAQPNSAPGPAAAAAAAAPAPEKFTGLLKIGIDLIDPNPLQPRTVFQPERLAELAQSIRSNGVIQPLVVQKSGQRYILVAGERRWRASRIAGLDEVPVVIQEYADDRILEIALIENIQREDLNPIEVAQALERLGRDLKLSHEQIGQRTGKDRTTVTNLLRLLRLPQAIQLLLAEHRLSMGHARAILGLPSEEMQVQTAERAAAQGMSVRQVERQVQQLLTARETPEPAVTAPDPNVKAANRELESVLGTRVRIVAKSPDRGQIEIEYYSSDDLDRIYNVIIGEKS